MSELLQPESRTIFERVSDLHFPIGQYVVVGGTMEAHGIRPARDVDIVVNTTLFDDLQEQGWPPYIIKPCCAGKEGTRRRLEKGDVQINSELSWEGVLFAETDDLIARASYINGMPFAPLNILAAWKRARGREKDLADNKLIQAYLDSGKNEN